MILRAVSPGDGSASLQLCEGRASAPRYTRNVRRDRVHVEPGRRRDIHSIETKVVAEYCLEAMP